MVRPQTSTPTASAAIQAPFQSDVTRGPSVVTPSGRKPRDSVSAEQPDSASRATVAPRPSRRPGRPWPERDRGSVRTAHLSDGTEAAAASRSLSGNRLASGGTLLPANAAKPTAAHSYGTGRVLPVSRDAFHRGRRRHGGSGEGRWEGQRQGGSQPPQVLLAGQLDHAEPGQV